MKVLSTCNICFAFKHDILLIICAEGPERCRPLKNGREGIVGEVGPSWTLLLCVAIAFNPQSAMKIEEKSRSTFPHHSRFLK